MNKQQLLTLIDQAAREGWTKLYLGSEELTELPPEIGRLTGLTKLDLGNPYGSKNKNRLTELPPEIWQLTNLQELDLNFTQLSALPPEIGQLTNLQTLVLSSTQLNALPPEIGQLTKLQTLNLFITKLSALPPEIGQLTNLKSLDLSDTQLSALPPEIGQLTKLKSLDLSDTQLSALPPEIGQLTKLQELDLSNNPNLRVPPPPVVEQGTQAVLAYLREQLAAARRQWVSKLLVVGEGGVGKTSLLRALRGEPHIEGLETTHGIQIETLALAHPTEADVTMQLKAWDFGGQEIYHATHQFFLTNRSLFALVWNARHGYQQGKLYYWLDAIQARAPQSPVILVATHTDERDADLPLSDLKAKYPQIVAHYAISNPSGAGIEDLRAALIKSAAGLPLMGEVWPADWLDAAEALRASPEKHITFSQLERIFEERGVESASVRVLARWLHELGDILYFQDDEALKDTVILKPQWVTEYISKVLESDEVIGRDGIFTRQQMRQLWRDLPPWMQDYFLRLMEQFDLSYRTLENREISLVVERLPLDPPDYAPQWDAIGETKNCREISMTYRLNTIPAGIPTWFIARSHRFTTHTHWRNGALFAYSDKRKHLALLRALPHERNLHLSVRGPAPHNFFTLLKDGLEVTLARFKGLKIQRAIPCPGHNGQACAHKFDYAHLQKAIERDPPVLELQCPVAFEPVSVPGLLFGLHWQMQDQVLARIDTLETRVLGKQDEILEELRDLRELTQREFTAFFRREQRSIDTHCPNVFTLRPRQTKGWKRAIEQGKVDLHLYCQAPGQWHPTAQGGIYVIDNPAQWLQTVAPYLNKLFAVLKYLTPVIGPWVAVADPVYNELVKDDIKLMAELLKKLPDLKGDAALKYAGSAGEHLDPERIGGAGLRALRQLLDAEDPSQHWGGLEKILTPEGHYLWLCEHHAKAYKV